MLPLLVEASPEFKSEWEKFVEEWKDDEELPHYIVLGDFARYLIAKLDRGKTDDFQKIFQAIERLHLEGDEYVREAATVGLLEGIQNVMGNNNKDPELFRQFLLPETTRWWDKLNKFWETGEVVTDD
jgi:hypothetical protein